MNVAGTRFTKRDELVRNVVRERKCRRLVNDAANGEGRYPPPPKTSGRREAYFAGRNRRGDDVFTNYRMIRESSGDECTPTTV